MARHYDISPRAVEPYLRCARTMLRQEAAKSREELRAEAYGFYRSVVRDRTVPTSARLRAQKRIDKLLVLDRSGSRGPTRRAATALPKKPETGFTNSLRNFANGR